MFLGWCLLIRSKWDQVRRGDVINFGVSSDRPMMRSLYRLSYFVMVSGALITCFSGSIPL